MGLRALARVQGEGRVQAAYDLGSAENIVSADAPQEVSIFVHLKREAVAFGDPAFPDVVSAFHFLDA